MYLHLEFHLSGILVFNMIYMCIIKGSIMVKIATVHSV